MLHFYLALIAIVLLATWWFVAQFRRPRRVWFVGDAKSEVEILIAERQMTLRTIKDLENERAAGKISEGVYASLREEAMQTAAQQTTRLGELQSASKDLRSTIEREVREALAAAESGKSAEGDATASSKSGKEAKA